MPRAFLLLSLAISSLTCGGSIQAPDASPEPVPDGRWALCGPMSVEHAKAVDIEVEDGRIVDVRPAGESPACEEDEAVDLSGSWVLPAFIDSHVHLAYYPVAEELARGGVVATVDLAAPLDFLGQDTSPVRTLWAGPMITAVDGYPTQGWGAGGYGLEVASPEQARAAVDQLHDAGASLIKLPLTQEPALDDATVTAIIERAHEHDLLVAVHAMDDVQVQRGAMLGADVLAHAPMFPLSEATLDAWAGRTVISTLAAFGSGEAAIENLIGLRARGVEVLYGTDLGNSRHVGIQPAELEALLVTGLDGEDVIAAGTTRPAIRWRLTDLGSLSPGHSASLLVVTANPAEHPMLLAEPERVLIAGEWMEPPVPPPPSVGG